MGEAPETGEAATGLPWEGASRPSMALVVGVGHQTQAPGGEVLGPGALRGADLGWQARSCAPRASSPGDSRAGPLCSAHRRRWPRSSRSGPSGSAGLRVWGARAVPSSGPPWPLPSRADSRSPASCASAPPRRRCRECCLGREPDAPDPRGWAHWAPGEQMRRPKGGRARDPGRQPWALVSLLS